MKKQKTTERLGNDMIIMAILVGRNYINKTMQLNSKVLTVKS